jgi:hypothetical protein
MAGGYRRIIERVNLTKIYFKYFVNVTMYPQYNNITILKKIKKVTLKQITLDQPNTQSTYSTRLNGRSYQRTPASFFFSI